MSLRLRTLGSALGAFLLPFLVGLGVHIQGFNLLDDGLWLLGSRLMAEGGILYRDLFSIYGPARYLVLAPFLFIIGKHALALAVLKAVLDGSAGLLGWWWLRRLGAGRWAWIVPVGVLALGPVYPRYLAAAAFSFWVGGLVGKPATVRDGRLTGLFWGLLALFGLDMMGYGAIVLLGALISGRRVSRGSSNTRLTLIPVVTGAGIVAVVTVLLALVTGSMGAAWWDTVVYPATRFGEAMGVSWLDTLRDGRVLGEAFAGHHTGEVLDAAWPGQSLTRVWGLRLMFLMVWVVPIALMAWGRKLDEARWAPLAALGLAGWVTLSARGDVEHLKLVWFAVLLMTPLLLQRLAAWRRPAGFAGVMILILALGPLVAEQVWLAAQVNREGLVVWDRPGARIRLAAERRDSLEKVCREVDEPGGGPLLIWPAQPGLSFVLGAPLATAQATLLVGEVRSASDVIDGVNATQPERAVIGSAWGLTPGVRSLRRLEPALWSYLRENYRFDREFVGKGEVFKILTRVPGGRAAFQTLPAAQRLSGSAQHLKTSSTPALGPGQEVVQTFRVEDFDLSGLALMFTAPGPFPATIDFRLAFLEIGPTGQSRELGELPMSVTLEQQVQKHIFPFKPLPGTRGKTLGIRIRDNSGGARPFALMWHKPDPESGGIDFHPTGQAYLNGQPVAADLYFVTY